MFGKMKDAYALQKELREKQKMMKKIEVEGISDDELITMTINGLQEIIDIDIHDELLSVENKGDLVKGLKQSMKNAQKNLQKEMTKEFDLESLKSMFGG